MSSLLEKINCCTTSKQLDELRIEIVNEMTENPSNFETLQKTFIRKKNSLRINGHTSNTEGYSLSDIIKEQRRKTNA